MRQLHIDLINAVAFRDLPTDDRNRLVRGTAKRLLQIRTVDQVKADLEQFKDDILVPAVRSRKGHNVLSSDMFTLRTEALRLVTRGIELIDNGNATAACATLWAAGNRGKKEYGQAEQEKWNAQAQKREQFGGRITYIPSRGVYRLYRGHYSHKQVGSLRVPVLAKQPQTFDSRWEVFRALDKILATEYGYLVQTPRRIKTLVSIAKRLDPGTAPSALTEMAQQLHALVPEIGAKHIIERKLAQKAILSAALLIQHEKLWFAHSQVLQAISWLRTRSDDIPHIIEGLEKDRADMRNFTRTAIASLKSQMVMARALFPSNRGLYTPSLAKTFRDTLNGLRIQVQSSKEPDLVLVAPGVSMTLRLFEQWFDAWMRTRMSPGRSDKASREYKERLRMAARRRLEDLGDRIKAASKLNGFMQSYGNWYSKHRLTGATPRIAEAYAFHGAFDGFVAQHKSMQRNLPLPALSQPHTLWWLKFYQAAFVSSKMDNPARKLKTISKDVRKRLPSRIANPVFHAFNLYFEMVRHNQIDDILTDPLIAQRIKTPAGQPDTAIWGFLEKMKTSGRTRLFHKCIGDDYALTLDERKEFERALAALPRRINPRKMAGAITGVDHKTRQQLEGELAKVPPYRIDPNELADARRLQRRPHKGILRRAKPRLLPIDEP